MRTFVCFVLLAAAACAESPRSRSARFELQRQETAPGGGSEPEPTTPRAGDAPYPAAGWRPSTEFKLPSRQRAAPPGTSYGTPLEASAAPQSEYGAPTEAPAAASTAAGGEESGATDVESLKVKALSRGEQSARQATEVQSDEGAYYVLLPDSRLQRVDYRTENDVRNMAYTARLQYRDENKAPIYVYTGVPQTATYSVPQVAAYSVPQAAAYSVPQAAAYSVPQTAAYSVQQTAAYAVPQSAAYIRYI